MRRRRLRKTQSCFLIALCAAAFLVLCTPTVAATKLDGTWRLADLSIDRVKGQALGGPIIETERPRSESLEESRTIQITHDVVTVVTKRRHLPAVSMDQYWLDDQPHTFEWGDTIPRETATRTGRWTADVDGFELTEMYRGTEAHKHRWTISSDGRLLTIESTDERPCPPCFSGVIRILRVFVRQP